MGTDSDLPKDGGGEGVRLIETGSGTSDLWRILPYTLDCEVDSSDDLRQMTASLAGGILYFDFAPDGESYG